jgi:N-acetylglucosaminyl-diphospho-decaprenol L-rhamnosyltransferase
LADVIEKTNENASGDPDITVVVVNYNTGHLLDRLFSNLSAARGSLNVRVIVVDNVSRDNSVEILRERYPNVILIQNSDNVGFGRANNQSLPLIRSRYVLLLNTDAFVSDDTLAKTVSFMEANPECGILGVKLVGETGDLQPSCRYFPTPWNVFLTKTGLSRFLRGARLVDDMEWDHATVRQCDWVPGCYYMIRTELIEQVGLFDPRFFLYYEEVDHCRAAKNAGWTVKFYPFTTVVHIGGESAKSHGPLTGAGQQFSALQVESELLYFRKHHGLAGLLGHLFLTVCSDTYLAIKGILRLPDARETLSAVHHLKISCQALVDTKLGSLPTR